MAKHNTGAALAEIGVTADATKKAQELLDAVLNEFQPIIYDGSYYQRKLTDVPSGKALLAQDRATLAAAASIALDRLAELEPAIAAFRSMYPGTVGFPSYKPGWKEIWNPRFILAETLRAVLRRDLPLLERDVIRLVNWPLTAATGQYPLVGLASAVENFAKANQISPTLASLVRELVKRLREHNVFDHESRKIADRLQGIASGGERIEIEPGEAWSDVARADLQSMKPKVAQAWNALLVHCKKGGAGNLTTKWQKALGPLIKAVGFVTLKEHLLRWFPLVDKPRTQPVERRHAWEPDYEILIKAPHVELLRGLAWCCGLQEDADLARALMRLAVSAYRKIPGKGPRLVSLGNACVSALGMMPGLPPIGQLALLKVKIKSGSAQKEIEKAFNASAQREGLPREEIEELAVPSYGLEEVGVLRESFGDYQAELTVDGSSVGLHWHKDGKPIKSVPAAVKKDHAIELKELHTALKDLNAMLPAQRERLDTLFLAKQSWPLAVWLERYLDHPLMGTIARRLIWTFSSHGATTHGIWHGGELLDVNNKTLDFPGETTVALWHPIGHPLDLVLAWRDWLQRREVVQPFKQAHREVYLLTDAERRTRVYSNRFAAHILRQHQFHALCASRGWKNKLRLLVVDEPYPPAHRVLPGWNLRAEFWIDGVGAQFGQETNEAGVFLYLATDQVRFYAMSAAQVQAHAGGGGYGPGWNQSVDEPAPLESIPPLVFSEIMRDVDLFVGVASVGNDPNWADGGPTGEHRDYWRHYSFGELSATAQTRRALLEQLLPRLKIAERCTLSGRFLQVRGNLRTYKVHLGSGNILMTPNDQYLCIVAKQTTAARERVFLPFEGDNLLSIILSKAFLLAEDAKLTDPAITSQLKK